MQNLSSGVIHQLMQGLGVQGPFYFQVLSMKAVVSKQANSTAPKRYRLILNDGINSTTMMLATQLQDVGENGPLAEGTIVRVGEIIPNDVQGRKVLIILSIDPVGHQDGVIGSPVPYGGDTASAANPAAAQQPPPAANPHNAGPGSAQPPGPAYGQAPNAAYGAQSSFNSNPGMAGGGQGYSVPAKGPGSFGAGPAGANGAGNAYGGAPARPQAGASAAPYGRPVPPPQYGGNGAVAHNEAPARIMPIKSLNPFAGRWTIKGRCTTKAELRRWSNMKGEGKLFSFDLLDTGGGEIRVTAFNDQVDKFFPLIEAGGIYMISKAGLKHKKPQFNSTNHDFEIQLERDSVIERCPDDDETRAIPEVLFNFRAISELGAVEAGAMVDLIGVVESVDSWQTIMRKTGEETRKRSMVLRDRSGGSIDLTLWGNYVHEPGDRLQSMVQGGERPVLAVKAARVGDFNGKTVSTVGSSVVRVNPEIQEAQDLLAWYAAGGSAERVVPLSGASGGGGGGRRCTLSSIKNEDLGHGEKPDWITVRCDEEYVTIKVAGTISYIKQDNNSGQSSVVYPSCSGQFNGRTCSKKMTDGGGIWHCDRCGHSCQEPEWKYLVSLQASDHTGVTWLTCIGESGEVMFDGIKAPELKAMELNNEKEFEKRVADANLNRMVFRLKVSEETYQDERRVKTSIFRMDHMDYAKECKMTLDLINKLENGVPVLIAKADAPGAAAPGAAPMGGNPYAQPNVQQQQQRWQGNAGGYGGGAGGGGGGGGAGGYGSPPGRAGGYNQQAPGGYGGGPRPMGAAGAGPRGTQQPNGYGGPAEGGGYNAGPMGPGYGGGQGFDNSGGNMGRGGGGYGGGPGGPGGYGGGNNAYGPPAGQQPGGGYGGPGPGMMQGGPQHGGGGYGGGPVNGGGGGYSAPPQQQGNAGYSGPNGMGGGYGGPSQQQQQAKPYW